MFLALLWTVFDSFRTMLWKKSSIYWVSRYLFVVIWTLIDVILAYILLFFWLLNFSSFSFLILFLVLLTTILYVFTWSIDQYVYSNEKISVLTPYENINKILSISFWFLIFWDISFLSFFISLIAWIIVVISSIDFKNLKVPRLIKVFFISQLILSLNILIVWYVLKNISAIDYFITGNILYFFFFLLLAFFKKQLDFKSIKPWFYRTRISSSALWNVGYFIRLLIISSLWVTMWILFSYLYVWFILVLSYLFLWDKPTKKNVILTIVLSLLVWLWYYFK